MKQIGEIYESEVLAACDAIKNQEWQRLLAMSEPPDYAMAPPSFAREWRAAHKSQMSDQPKDIDV